MRLGSLLRDEARADCADRGGRIARDVIASGRYANRGVSAAPNVCGDSMFLLLTEARFRRCAAPRCALLY
jgi:hypothetical protein